MSQLAVIYCRISQDREGAGLGVDRQEQDCRALAERLGFTVVEVYTDNDVSAYKRSTRKRREGYEQLLAGVKAGRFQVILAWHTDRLHRSNLELEHYIDVCHNVPTYTVKAGTLDLSTAAGRLFARQLGAVARYQSEHMAEQIEARRKQRVFNGGNAGGPRAFGFEDGGLVIRESEAREIREATRKIIGGASLGSVMRDLNDRGILTSRGREWSLVNLRAVLLRPRNAGILVYKDQEAGPAPWPAIVPELTWRQCRAVLADPARRSASSNRPSSLGGGLYRCGVCNSTMRIAFSGQNSRVRGYRCSAGAHVTQAAAPLDAYVMRALASLVSQDFYQDMYAKVAATGDEAFLEEQLKTFTKRLVELGEAFAAGEIDIAMFKAAGVKLREEKENAERQLAGIAKHKPSREIRRYLKEMKKDPLGYLGRLPLDEQRKLLAVFADVTVYRAPHRGGRFDPSRIGIKWWFDKEAIRGPKPEDVS